MLKFVKVTRPPWATAVMPDRVALTEDVIVTTVELSPVTRLP